jgi:hypothetical protein
LTREGAGANVPGRLDRDTFANRFPEDAMRFRFLLIVALALLALAPEAAPVRAQEITRVGEDIHVAAGETASQVSCVRCSARIDGRVTGDVAVVMGSLEINGEVGGDVAAVMGHISLGADAEVRGDILAVLGRLDRHPSARVRGDVQVIGAGMAGLGLGMMLLAALVFGAVLFLLLVLACYALAGQQRIETVAATVRTRAGMALLAGLGTAVVAVVALFIAAYLGPAAPILALLVALLCFGAVLVGYTGLSAWLGRAVSSRAAPLGAVMIGVILIILIQAVPVIGWAVGLVFAVLAVGAAVLSGFGSSTDWLPRQLGGAAPAPPAPPVSPQS